MGKKPELDNITLPVYEVCHKELEDAKEEIPTEQEITTLAKAAIAADKDIVSQIEYDESGNSYILPKGVLPLKIRTVDGDIFYFDFGNEIIKNEDNTANKGTVYTDSKYCVLVFSEEGFELNVEQLIYILYDNDAEEYPASLVNTYYILNPVTSAGTKLYKHSIQINNGQGRLVLISNISSALGKHSVFGTTGISTADNVPIGEGLYVFCGLWITSNTYNYTCFVKGNVLVLYDLDNNAIVNLADITTGTDTITAL